MAEEEQEEEEHENKRIGPRERARGQKSLSPNPYERATTPSNYLMIFYINSKPVSALSFSSSYPTLFRVVNDGWAEWAIAHPALGSY